MTDLRGVLPLDARDPRFRVFQAHVEGAARSVELRALGRELAGCEDLPDGWHQMTDHQIRRAMVARLLRAVQERVLYVRTPTFLAPMECWSRGWGDCKSSATLLASLALSVGATPLLVPMGRPRDPSHVACMLRWPGSGDWTWAETTLDAHLGEHPLTALARLEREGRAPARDDVRGAR